MAAAGAEPRIGQLPRIDRPAASASLPWSPDSLMPVRARLTECAWGFSAESPALASLL